MEMAMGFAKNCRAADDSYRQGAPLAVGNFCWNSPLGMPGFRGILVSCRLRNSATARHVVRSGSLVKPGSIMRNSNVPVLDAHYWITILVASLLGTTFGDFVSNDLGLGFAGGLLVLSAVIAVIFVAEFKLKWNSVVWYWAAIVATRTAATNLGDFLSRTAKLGNGQVAAILAVLLVAFLFVTARRTQAATGLGDGGAGKILPKTDARYWTAILIASTFGTTMGDFISGDLGLGLGRGSLVLGLLLAVILAFELRARTANEARYWSVIALVRTTGTVMGDYLTSEEGLHLGFAVGASVVGALLIVLVFAVPRTFAVTGRAAVGAE